MLPRDVTRSFGAPLGHECSCARPHFDETSSRELASDGLHSGWRHSVVALKGTHRREANPRLLSGDECTQSGQ